MGLATLNLCSFQIWSLDGRAVQVLDRSLATPLDSRPIPGNDVWQPPPDPSTARGNVGPSASGQRSITTVRDVSWHTGEPSLMSTSWEGSGDRHGGSESLQMDTPRIR